jgi:membrane peptidoglycan carboxypeptidase
MRGWRFPTACFLLSVMASACALPDLEDYRARPLAQTTFLYAADGSLITELHADQDRVVLPMSEMPRFLRDAVVAIEDRRFYQHHGIDVRAILRAAYSDAAKGRIIEGGSTITQQLVKNLYVGDEVSFRRKVEEAALALQLEDQFTKEQILTKYLNTVYLGNGAYGVQAAARTYFSVNANNLTLPQAATLAALVSSPGRFDPLTKPDSAVGRRNVVLRLMGRLGFIDPARSRRARRAPLGVNQGRTYSRYPYPYFVDYLKTWFLANPAFGRTREDRYRALFTGGLRIESTLDPALQDAAESATRQVLVYPEDPDAAMTVLDPGTGFVKAMVGGDPIDYWRDRDGGRVNLATGAGGTGRQTGSAFKPFALVAALEHGISPDTVFPAPWTIEIPLDAGHVWSVTNAEGAGQASMSLRSATVHSVNTVYAQLITELGPDEVIDAARRMGLRCCRRVSSPSAPLLANPAAVLGTNEVNTLEMASAYGTLATGGRRVGPLPVTRVTDADGTVVWEANPRLRQVLDPEVASVADDILQEVVSSGTGIAAAIGRPQIGKTGTASDHTNAWFVGAVPQLVTAVWVGFKEGLLPMEPPRTRITVFGGTWPAQIWRLFMLRATRAMPPRSFPTPQVDYVAVSVDVTQDPLCLPNRFTLPQNIGTLTFIEGTEPATTCRTPTSSQLTTVPSAIGLEQSQAMDLLKAAGFYVTVEVARSTQPPGTVIFQSPSAGVDAYQTSTITITVSRAGSPGSG